MNNYTETNQEEIEKLKDLFYKNDNETIDEQIDRIYDFFDDMFLVDGFDRVDFLLSKMSPKNYPMEVNLGILTASLPAKRKLFYRGVYFKIFRNMLEEMTTEIFNTYCQKDESNPFNSMSKLQYIDHYLLKGLEQ